MMILLLQIESTEIEVAFSDTICAVTGTGEYSGLFLRLLSYANLINLSLEDLGHVWMLSDIFRNLGISLGT